MERRICIDCGAPFELTDDNIEFFQKQNLHLPRRCSKCRALRRYNELPYTKQEPVQVPSKELPHFYARPIPRGKISIHKNARHHIFNERGVALCGQYNCNHEDYYFTQVCMKGGLSEEVEKNLCKTCKELYENANR